MQALCRGQTCHIVSQCKDRGAVFLWSLGKKKQLKKTEDDRKVNGLQVREHDSCINWELTKQVWWGGDGGRRGSVKVQKKKKKVGSMGTWWTAPSASLMLGCFRTMRRGKNSGSHETVRSLWPLISHWWRSSRPREVREWKERDVGVWFWGSLLRRDWKC